MKRKDVLIQESKIFTEFQYKTAKQNKAAK